MDRNKTAKIVLGVFIPLLVVGVQWMTDPVQPGNLMMETPKVMLVPWLESNHTYLLLNLLTFIPVFLLSFDRNVHYYRKWKYLFPAIAITGMPFLLWDAFFTLKGVWGFNDNYFLGPRLLYLPMEEWLFFFTVPFACVFIYECLNFYLPLQWPASLEKWITASLILSLLFLGFARWSHMYTATTFLLTGFFLLFHLLFLEGRYRIRIYLAYLLSWIPFLLVNGALTGAFTAEPVVCYNPDEYFGIRISSVPIDDSVYSLLLLLIVVTFFEFFRKN